MMPVRDLVSKTVQYMADNYSKDSGKLLVHLGALGWIFGSLAQWGVVAADKNIEPEKKKFLLNQEAADGAVNVVMYYTICEAIKSGCDKLVESGKFLTDEVVQKLAAIKGGTIAVSDPSKWRSLFTQAELEMPLTKMLAKGKELGIVNFLSEPEKTVDAIRVALETVEKHKNNVGVVAAIFSSVLACNVVTPYVRNIIASKLQKSESQKEITNIKKTQIKENFALKHPLPTSFKAFNSYNSQTGMKI